MFPPVSPDDRDLTSVFITLYLLNVIYVPNCFFTTKSLNLSLIRHGTSAVTKHTSVFFLSEMKNGSFFKNERKIFVCKVAKLRSRLEAYYFFLGPKLISKSKLTLIVTYDS